MPSNTATTSISNFSIATVYTARDFAGYTLQHLKAMYPTRWQEAAHHFGVELPESTVARIKQTVIEQQVWDFYPTTQPVIDKMLNQAQIQPHHRVLEPTNSVRPTALLWNREARLLVLAIWLKQPLKQEPRKLIVSRLTFCYRKL